MHAAANVFEFPLERTALVHSHMTLVRALSAKQRLITTEAIGCMLLGWQQTCG